MPQKRLTPEREKALILKTRKLGQKYARLIKQVDDLNAQARGLNKQISAILDKQEMEAVLNKIHNIDSNKV